MWNLHECGTAPAPRLFNSRQGFAGGIICALVLFFRHGLGGGNTAFILVSSLVSRSFFQHLETLACLPFLIWELSGGRFQKMPVVSNRFSLLVQRIVRCGPKEVG